VQIIVLYSGTNLLYALTFQSVCYDINAPAVQYTVILMQYSSTCLMEYILVVTYRNKADDVVRAALCILCTDDKV
jgi:hypothetical protein